MKILGGDEKSIDDYVNEGTITYKSGNDLNANIKSMYTIEVTFVNIPNTNKDTIEISEKTDIYCYEYINNKWQAYGLLYHQHHQFIKVLHIISKILI